MNKRKMMIGAIVLCALGTAAGYAYMENVYLEAAKQQEAAINANWDAWEKVKSHEQFIVRTAAYSKLLAAQPPRIEINLASRLLSLYMEGHRVRLYPVAVGSASTPSPTGEFTIVYKEVNPVWVNPKKKEVKIPSGPANPLGYRWMGIGGNYGIHGTNMPWSIGHSVSNGCIRMHEEDVEELFSLVNRDTLVKIYYDRLVLEPQGNDLVNCYIYEDHYGWEDLDSQKVRQKFAEIGYTPMVSDAEINSHIESSDGQLWPVKVTKYVAPATPPAVQK